MLNSAKKCVSSVRQRLQIVFRLSVTFPTSHFFKILSHIRFQTRHSIRRFMNSVTRYSLVACVSHQFHSTAKTFCPEASSFDSDVSTMTLRLFCHCDAVKLTKPLHLEYFMITELPLDFYIRDVILLKRQNSKNAFSPRPPRGRGQHCSQFTDDTCLHCLSRLFQIRINIHAFFCLV